MDMRFGDFVLRTSARQLQLGGRERHLSPKAFDLLVRLIESRPAVQSKQVLMDWLWPDSHVEEVNLANLVTEIRRALMENSRSPTFIRTHHRVGYAWIGDCQSADARERPAGTPSCVLLFKGVRLLLGAGEHVIGRSSPQFPMFDAPTVSRRHARLVITPEDVTIEDLGSRNGTFVSDRPVTTVSRVHDGDEIRLAGISVTLRMPAARTTATMSPLRDEQMTDVSAAAIAGGGASDSPARLGERLGPGRSRPPRVRP